LWRLLGGVAGDLQAGAAAGGGPGGSDVEAAGAAQERVAVVQEEVVATGQPGAGVGREAGVARVQAAEVVLFMGGGSGGQPLMRV
jgi:hypothetical protein